MLAKAIKVLAVFCMLAPAAFGQRGGAGGHGGPKSFRPAAPGRIAHGGDRAPLITGSSLYGFGYGWPGYSSLDYLDAQPGYDLSDQYGQQQYQAPMILLPPPAMQAPPVQHATSVIHDYNFSTQPVAPRVKRATFTIVLKDGSELAAVASWVARDKLHYVDLKSMQHVLSHDAIDRDATERANEAKNLNMELPPG